MKQKRSILILFAFALAVFFAYGANAAGDELLLVNRENPLPEDYVPEDLVPLSEVIPEGMCTYEHEGILAEREAAEAWAELLAAAREDGLSEWRFSEGYRTWEAQKELFDESVQSCMDQYGMSKPQAAEATAYLVAEPGTSEHHTGLAFDITVPGEYFADTAQYLWMKQHCWEYGFILRYTDEKEDITGFMSEEWHYRYVGREHALRMRDLDMCLEEYTDFVNAE